MGALQLVAGHFGLALDSARLSAAASPGLGIFYASLALIATGVGFLKTNASTLVGALSERDDPRRDAGFTLFYLGYNTGGVIAPLVCIIGHARSTIVDTIYAHTVESALAGVSERVAGGAGRGLISGTLDKQ